MNVLSRGIRNAFRNGIRTFSIIVILALSIALALTMVMARGAVQKKIDTINGSIGNTVSLSPAGVRGFEGGGSPLTAAQITSIKNLPHITSITETVQDRLTTTNSNLVSAISAGSLGQRFAQNNGSSSGAPAGGFGGGQGGGAGTSDGTATRSFTPPVTVSGTNDLNGSAAASDGAIKLTSGVLFDPNSTTNVALLGKDLASKNNLKVGSTFTAYNGTIKVVGIYDTGTTFSNNTVVMPLTTLQTLSAQTDEFNGATVNVDSISNVSGVVAAIKSKLGSSTIDVTSGQDQAATALSPLENIKTISLFSMIGAIIAGAVIILLTMVMIVRERRREIGVLKAIGASNLKVMYQFMAEAVTFTIIAAAVGIVLGVVGGNPITQVLVNSSSSTSSGTAQGQNGFGGAGAGGGFARRNGGGAVGAGTARQGGFGGGARRLSSQLGFTGQNLKNVKAVVGWSVLLYGLGAAILIALVGSAVAALLIAKIRPAEVMRVE